MTLSKVKVGVILPSRGLMFSKTADELLQNLKGINHRFFFAHKLPIPDCFEIPTNLALQDESITHLFFVEDDMIFPKNTLKKLLRKDKDMITCDYPVDNKGRGAILQDKEGRVVFSGTGCLLVKREMFDLIKKPYFRSDVSWNINNYGNHVRLIASKSSGDLYGLHDVNFGIRFYMMNRPIELADFTIGQRKLLKMGQSGSNDGAHQIEEWTKVTKDYFMSLVKKYPVMPTGSLVTVIAKDGNEIETDAVHAKKLVKAKLAKYAPKRSVVIDHGDLL